MKKIIIFPLLTVLFSLCAVFFFSKVTFAETLYLKNGRKVQGKIVEKNEKFTKVDVSGVKVTYYADEIDHVQEDAPAPTPSASGASFKPAEKIEKPPLVIKPDSAPALPAKPSPSSSNPNLLNNSEVFSAPMPEGTKKELILTLIDAMGTKEALQAMLAQVSEQASPQEKESLQKVLNLDEVLNRLVPVYDKYFSEEEIKVLTSFYKSPVGKKLIKVTPALMEDSMKANVSYFQESIPKSLKQ